MTKDMQSICIVINAQIVTVTSASRLVGNLLSLDAWDTEFIPTYLAPNILFVPIRNCLVVFTPSPSFPSVASFHERDYIRKS